MHILKIAWSILTKDDRSLYRRNFAWNLLEPLWSFLGLISVIPFLYMVVNPDLAIKHNQIAFVRTLLGSPDANSFLIMLGSFSFAVLIMGNCYSLYVVRQNSQFIAAIGRSMSSRLFQHFLLRDYVEQLTTDRIQSREIILRYSRLVAEHWFLGVTKLICTTIGVLLIVATILVSSPLVAVLTIIIFGTLYFFVYVGVRNKLKALGIEINAVSRELGRIASDPLTAIKEVLLFNKFDDILKEHHRLTIKAGQLTTSQTVTTAIPRYAIEVLAFGVLLMTTIYMLMTVGSAGKTIPVIGVFAFACQKLAPAMRVVFAIVASMRFNITNLQTVHKILKPGLTEQNTAKAANSTSFTNSFRLSNVSFRYPGSMQDVFTKINLEIKSGGTFGIIGASGRGKTTLINIMAGILKPTAGQLYVDGKVLESCNLPSWRENIAYVGQDMFLFDSTIGRNIAFSLYDSSYDQDKVVAAAKSAAIHDYIMELEDGYDTKVGQNGIRLSGGQRQRIGIARALYKNASILILDEATNALDGMTEDSFFYNLANVIDGKTIILITHNPKSAERCDEVFDLETKSIVPIGSKDFEKSILNSSRYPEPNFLENE